MRPLILVGVWILSPPACLHRQELGNRTRAATKFAWDALVTCLNTDTFMKPGVHPWHPQSPMSSRKTVF